VSPPNSLSGAGSLPGDDTIKVKEATMSRSRGKIRKKKQFRRLMRRGGACSLCAPMLRHPAGTTNVSSFTCPGGHEIAFTPSLEAYDTLARCISVPLSTCHDGYRISCGGEVKYERECGCDGQHADFQVEFTTDAKEVALGE